MVFALVFARGAVNAIDNPTRQSFVIEMVGADRRGERRRPQQRARPLRPDPRPGGAGILIATIGVAPCFLLNAATFAAMIVVLRRMDPARLSGRRPADARSRGGVARRARATCARARARDPAGDDGVVGTLGFNFQVLLPLLGRFTFDGGAAAYTALAVAMAVGSVAGALATGARGRVSERLLIVGAPSAFGRFALLAAAAPTLPLALAALVPLGAATRDLRRRRQLDPAARGRARRCAAA